MKTTEIAPGHLSVTRNKSKKAATPKAKVISGISLDIADNGGISARVSERYKSGGDTRGDEAIGFIEPKTYVYGSWAEASEAIGQMLAEKSPAPATPQATMGDLTEDLDEVFGGGMAVGADAADTYKSASRR
ncbi:MAG: hypothetical protein NUW22_13550 [Acidobacteria bacterium]|nr:hypothetical protein [Acidobacteriota bacterium]